MMNKTIIIIFLLIFNPNKSFTQLSKKEYENVVSYFVNCIKNADIEKLDSIVSYPINRPYPIPPIKNKEELQKRYSELFDDVLTKLIINSNIKEDWSDVGWRGIMLHNGIVWIDYDGRFITTNYISKKEREVEKKWLDYEKNVLHTDLKNFSRPIHTIETDEYIVRIDILDNQHYRYASWRKESDITKKPDLIIYNGEWVPDGSGGNHHYIFTNGEYRYIIYVNVLGLNDIAPFYLEVIKKDKVILKQSAELKKIE